MDDDDSLNRLIAELGLELPDVADNGDNDAEPPRFDDLEGSEWL